MSDYSEANDSILEGIATILRIIERITIFILWHKKITGIQAFKSYILALLVFIVAILELRETFKHTQNTDFKFFLQNLVSLQGN